MSVNDSHLTKKQIFLSRLALGGAVFLLGIFLLLCGTDAIKIPLFKILLPSGLFAVSLVCFLWAFIQDNTLMLWLAMPAALAGLISVLAVFTNYGYGTLYPIYIIAPAAASVTTCLYSKKWREHIKVIVFFGISAAIFSLNSFWNVNWAVVLPIFVLFLGASIAAYALSHKEK